MPDSGQYNQFPIDWQKLNASKVPYSNATSGLSATDVQGAIDELKTDLNAIDASDVPYDNTASGLTADDVQEALDELASEKQDTLTAGDGITISSDTISTDNDATLTSATKPAQAKAVGDALNSIGETLKADFAPVITDTASGSIATFPDGADGYPLKECVVDVDAVQDLHGYDNPWPAGGGKNLFNGTFLQGYWAYANGIFVGNNEWVATSKIPCKPSTAYTVSSDTRLTRWQGFVWYDSNDAYISTDNLQQNTNIGLTKTSPANAAYMIFNIAESSSGEHISPSDVTHFQLEEGSTATPYAPYSNICPITGWAQAKVADDPEYGGDIVWNQLIGVPVFTSPFTHNGVTFTKNTADNSVTVNGTVQGYTNAYAQISNNTGIVIGHKYYIRSGSDSGKVKIWYNGPGGLTQSVETIGTITSIANGFYLRVDTEGTSVNETVRSQAFDLTLMFGEGNEPSTVEEFKTLFPKKYYPQDTAGTETYVSAVNGDPYRIVTIPFNTTCYGGVLDVTRGKLRVTHKYWTSQGTAKTDWTSSGNGGYYTQKNYGFDSLTYSHDGYCNMFIYRWSFGQTNGIMAYSNRIQVSNSPFSTLDEFFDAITATPIQLVYPLATPIEVDLTPTEITTLLGTNNIFADTGDVEVEYCADTKKYIQKLISQLA